LEELQEAGYAVDSVYDLVRIKTPYKTAIPILLKWLPRVNASDAKENIIDRLAVPYAKPGVARPLIEEFLKAPDVPEPKYKMRIAEALRIIADEEVYDDMVAILRDKRHGGYRTSIAEALGHMKNPGAVDVLIEMLSDEEIGGHAIAGLRALKDPKARPFLEPFLTHKEYWWRKEAAAAIKAIDKKIEREKAKETHV
jgi:HEAT repeat protein